MKPEWLVEISAWKFQTFQNLKSTLRRRGPGLIGNFRTTTTAWSTTTGSELHCTAQARLVNFVVVVSSTTPNKVESRRPAIHMLRQV